MPDLEVRDLGLVPYQQAFLLQQSLAERRKRDEIPDQLLLVEHPHVITLGRNARDANILAPREVLERAGIEVHVSNRGGDVTYHGPGQIVGYPILDLRAWKRDVVAYVRALEQALIDTIAPFGIEGRRAEGMTGVWVGDAKVAAIGVHISRWTTTHGFALNVETDLSYFRYIVPCGLSLPVTSLRQLGCHASNTAVKQYLIQCFGRIFDRSIMEPQPTLEKIA
jgi:lipoyl(octanoyl) transferase